MFPSSTALLLRAAPPQRLPLALPAEQRDQPAAAKLSIVVPASLTLDKLVDVAAQNHPDLGADVVPAPSVARVGHIDDGREPFQDLRVIGIADRVVTRRIVGVKVL